jgi:hypothetical protein
MVVRDLTCLEWDFFARLANHAEMCYFFDMVGAECGCTSNLPPPDACGPLCGDSEETILPHPDKTVQGQTCSQWNSMATFLFEGYGSAMPNTASMIPSCDSFFGPLAYGCGCVDRQPPANGCGRLCGDDELVPDPKKIIGDRTCGDLDRCYRYSDILAPQCGCNSETNENVWNTTECIAREDLDGKSFFFTSGMSQYSVSFGDTGRFEQIQNNNAVNLIGGFTSYHDGGGDSYYEASYGGGARCGQFGPRRGSVVLVRDDTLVAPKPTSVIEPSTCVYRATLGIPRPCPM